MVTEDTMPILARFRTAVFARFPLAGTTVDRADGWVIDGPGCAHNWVSIGGFAEPVSAETIETPTGTIVARSHPIAELVTCPWCVSVYLGFGAVVARAVAPRWWDRIARPLAFSMVAGWLANH